MKDVIKIWKEKDKILEGIKNFLFKKTDVEDIAAERMAICSTCPEIDHTGSKCIVPGTGPCCGLCGCSLSLKTRALSAKCDAEKWEALLTMEEQALVDQHFYKNDNSISNEINI